MNFVHRKEAVRATQFLLDACLQTTLLEIVRLVKPLKVEVEVTPNGLRLVVGNGQFILDQNDWVVCEQGKVYALTSEGFHNIFVPAPEVDHRKVSRG